jgi:ABC-type branched-subunit amino acid transport system substrate-binding protein
MTARRHRITFAIVRPYTGGTVAKQRPVGSGRWRARSRALAVVSVAAIVAAACSSSHKAASSSSPTTASSSTGSTGSVVPSSAQGVTNSTITVGNVATLTGPVPGLFQGAPYGVDAYFQYINSQGGVDGRKLVVKSGDDQLSCSGAESATQSLVGSVFTFVGSESVLDSCMQKVIPSTLPVVPSESLTPQTRNAANWFPAQPEPAGFYTGFLKYLRATYPNITKVGSLYGLTVTPLADAWNNAIQSVGFNIIYKRGIANTETDFTSDVVRMKQSGVQMYFAVNAAGQDAAILNEMQQQNFHPLVVFYNSYYPQILTESNPGAANGVLNFQPFAMFQGEDRATVPVVNTFLTWMDKTHPSFKPDLFAALGWDAATLFVQALKQMGPNNLTQQALGTALSSIHTFNAGGMEADMDIASHQPAQCWLEMKVVNGHWVRQLPAKSGFDCQYTGFLPYSGS